MHRALTLWGSSIGQKAIVAVTGLILIGFLTGHLAGNLLVFAGPEAFNGYAAALHAKPPLVWGTRVVVLLAFVVHIRLTILLARRNAAARPVGYSKARQDQLTTYAARTMILSGPLLGAYVVFHLAHFTVPGLDLGGPFSHTNIYLNLVRGFRIWWVSAIYIFANFLLGLHLYHGAWSALQTLGLQHPKWDALRQRLAVGFGVLVAAGFISIPIAVQARIVGTEEQLTESASFPSAVESADETPEALTPEGE